MTNRDIAIENILRVARKLGYLRQRVVFLGGSITALLITDTGAPDVRQTKDVDVIFRSGSLTETYGMDEALMALGFRHCMGRGAPTCRWVVDECLVDVIPLGSGPNAYDDRWSPSAIDHAESLKLENGIWIRHVSAAYFVGIKLETFADRGAGDYLYSQDIDDIIQVVDGRPELAADIDATEPDLRAYVADEFRALLATRSFLDSIPAHLFPDAASQARESLIIERMTTITSPGSTRH